MLEEVPYEDLQREVSRRDRITHDKYQAQQEAKWRAQWEADEAEDRAYAASIGISYELYSAIIDHYNDVQDERSNRW